MLFEKRIRPGASIIVKSEVIAPIGTSARGTVIMPVLVSWGQDGELVEVTGSQLRTGEFTEKYGIDTDTTNLELALSGAKKVLVFTMNNGAKATKEIDSTGKLTATAKYKGTFGNRIRVGVFSASSGKVVRTEVNGEVVDEQKVETNYTKLKNNDYVDFNTSGSSSINDKAYVTLTGGTDVKLSDYSTFFKKAETSKWNVLACIDSSMNTKAKSLIQDMRELDGIKVQATMVDSTADYEGIIKLTEQKVMYNGKQLTGSNLCAYVGGITAGATMVDSNTARVTPFEKIVDELTPTQIIQALSKGYFIFTYTVDSGKVRVESDINSLTTITEDKADFFSKNKIIRVLDEIVTSIKSTFETSYEAKIDNNKQGRESYRNSLLVYFNNLVNLNAINDFDPEDLLVKEVEKDSIYVQFSVSPVDKIEKLYMLVKVK